jgi:hypothetical protein
MLSRVASLVFCMVIATGCSHPLEIIGQGNIISDSGNRDCTLAAFQGNAATCTENIVLGHYDETYTAVPEASWQFFRWLNYCQKDDLPECAFEVPAAITNLAWGESVPPLVAEFSQGAVFTWSSDNAGVVRGPTGFSLEVGGISAVARAYVALWSGLHYEIFGPYPTKEDFSRNQTDGFVLSDVYHALMLEAGPVGGIALPYTEEGWGGAGSQGFDNYNYYLPGQGPIQSNFLVVEFDEPVDLGGVGIGTGPNYDADYWLASSLQAPDLTQDLPGALSGFTLTLHNKGGGNPLLAQGLANQHKNFRYLIMGASLNPATGVLPQISNPDASWDMFRLQSLTVRPAL